jgi:hypothetical protein
MYNDTMPDSPSKPKRKRSWYRSSLRTFLLVVTAFAVWFGWVMHKAREQRRVVAWVEKMGGEVGYEYEVRLDGTFYDSREPPGPEWLRDLVGIDCLHDVVLVDLGVTNVTDLSPLAGLGDLRHLYLWDTPVSDLRPLEGQTNLRALYLYKTPVSDLTPLARLTNLISLGVGDSISEEEANNLVHVLPNCMIFRGDPNHLYE